MGTNLLLDPASWLPENNWSSSPCNLNTPNVSEHPPPPKKKTSWRFQPIWRICSSNWIISPKDRGDNQKIFELPPPKKKHIRPTTTKRLCDPNPPQFNIVFPPRAPKHGQMRKHDQTRAASSNRWKFLSDRLGESPRGGSPFDGLQCVYIYIYPYYHTIHGNGIYTYINHIFIAAKL